MSAEMFGVPRVVSPALFAWLLRQGPGCLGGDVARVAASAVREEARRTAELHNVPEAGLQVLTPEDLVVAGCLAHMLLSRHADWSRSRVIWAVRGWVAMQARYYAYGRYDA